MPRLPRPTRFASEGIAVQARRHLAIAVVLAAVLAIPAVLATALLFSGSYHLDAALLAVGFTSVVAAAAFLLRMWITPLVSAPPKQRAPAELAFLADGSLLLRWEDEKRRYPPQAVLEGWMEDVAGADVVSVVLRTRGDDLISVTAADAAEAERMLQAAGVSAAQRALRLRLGPETRRAELRAAPWLLASLMGSLAYADLATILGFGAFLAVSALLLFASMRRQVVVGADGITLERPLVRRFIPFHAVVEVVKEPGAVVVVLERERVPLSTGPANDLSYEHLATQAALFDRIEQARRCHAEGASALPDLAALDRSGRSLADWRTALRRLTSGEASYRHRVLPREVLEAVVADPSATAERRIGAALALASGEAQSRACVERSAASCADERLRAALSAAAVEALAEEEMEAVLEAEAAVRRRA